jgi:pimeloyl-ACP methyl ester carboxylesterase
MMSTPFEILNDHNLPIYGDTHEPDQQARACIVILHGYKGYKDYGFIPLLAHDLSAQGNVVHRFNFSTSGVTNDYATFARPDLFTLDTWMRQVADVRLVVSAIKSREIMGQSLPLFLVGHSRGGATALLSAGLHREEFNLSGICTINAVDRCSRLTVDDQRRLLNEGHLITKSARTNQELLVGADWLSEQMTDPDSHDVLLQAERCGVPSCVIQGDADEAVSLKSGLAIAHKLKASLDVLIGCNHVLNMPNPSRIDDPRSKSLLQTTQLIARLIEAHGHATI